MLASVVTSARRQARQTDCKSNLRQFGAAILVYRGEHESRNPPWMSKLFPEYVDDKHIFICRSDKNKGLDRVRPADLPAVAEPDKFKEVIDNRSGARVPVGNDPSDNANSDIVANSYFYEFSAAKSPWSAPDLNNDGEIAWWEYKENQLRVGDVANGGGSGNPKPYSQSRLPIIRCYHHHKELSIEGHQQRDPPILANACTIVRGGITLNVAYAGNVWVAPLWWEGALQPGE